MTATLIAPFERKAVALSILVAQVEAFRNV